MDTYERTNEWMNDWMNACMYELNWKNAKEMKATEQIQNVDDVRIYIELINYGYKIQS